MKIWTKVHLKDRNLEVELISKALANYLYFNGPIDEICKKYNISTDDRMLLDRYTTNRIAGILMLYLANDTSRINDIVNRYNIPDDKLISVFPEIEGYINK